MVSSVRLKKLFRSWYGPRKLVGAQRPRHSSRFWLELLEDRLAPATLSDGGTAVLSIVLGAGEQLAITSSGTSYTFASNQAINAASAADPANQAATFFGLGSDNLLMTSSGLSHYSKISITDSGPSAAVAFNNSGGSAYVTNFTVALSDPAAGAVTFNGQSSFGASNVVAATTGSISVTSGASIATSSGNVTLQADHLLVDGTITAATGKVTLLPQTDGTLINLGTDDSAGTFGLTAAKLGHITAGSLEIGSIHSGTITISAAVTFATATNVSLVSGGDIIFSTGSVNTGGGALTLTPGSAGSVQPVTSGTDVTSAPGSVAIGTGSKLAIAINGITVDDGYNQLNVTGDVNLTGAALTLGGTLTPVAEETFTIVNNAGTHPVTGTFTGLPEGSVIANFLGSPLSAVITYAGGDGNDVVLTVKHATTTTVTASTGTTTYGQAVTFTATVTMDSGIPAGSVEFFDDTTGADLGAGLPQGSSPGSAKWILATAATQLQVAGGAHVIRAVYTPTGSILGSAGTLAGGETVTPLALTVTGFTAGDKTYDATKAAAVHAVAAALVGIIAGDAVTLNASGATGAFASKDVGSAITVTVSGLTLSGAQANNYAVTPPTATANITRAPVTLTGIKVDKVYDSTTAATLNTASAALAGVFAGDSLTLSTAGATATFASKDAGTGIAVNVSGLALGGAQANDYALTPPTVTGNITPATLTVTGVTASDKVYDSTTKATLNTTSAALGGTVYAGDAVTLVATGIAGAFASKEVGTGITVNVSGFSLGGAQASDYALQQPAPTANITPAKLTVTGITASDKVYNATTTAVLNTAGATVSGVLAGDNVTLNAAGAAGAFAGKDVGNGLVVTVTGLTLTGTQAGDYTLTPPTATANITPATVTVTGITANDKTYDATTAATLNTAGAALVGVFSGDGVTLGTAGATGTFASNDVGAGIAVKLSGLGLSGAQAGDYVLTEPATTANITAAKLTVTGITAKDKTYDATTNATLDSGSATLVGVFAGDTVTLNTSGATATFASKDAGTGIAVAISGLTLAGSQAGDYALTQPAATANITPATLTVTGITAHDKVYDSTTKAALSTTAAALAGTVYGADAVTLDSSGALSTFASKDVGAGIAVNVSGLTLTGAQAGDYHLTPPVASANITQAELTVTGIKAKDKVYDATKTATLDTTGAVLAGVFAGDNVTLNAVGATGTFAGKDVGTGITVSVSGLTTLGGAQAGDYTLTAPVTTANITPAPVTVTGLTADKTYDGTTAAPINSAAAALAGVFAGDAVTLNATGAAGTFASKDAANGITVTVSGLTIGGAQVGDYALTQPTLTGNITPAKVTITGIIAKDKVYDSTTAATLDTAGAAFVGVLASDAVALNAASAIGVFASKDAGTGIAVTISGLKLDGAQAADYAVTQPTTTANITPAKITVTGITANDKVYDSTTKATLNTAGATFSGVFAGDKVTLNATGATSTFASKDVGTSIVVTVSGAALGGDQAGDYTLTQPTTTANITPAPLTVTGIAASDKVYDGTPKATLNTASAALVGVFAGDNVTLSASGASGAFASKDVGQGIAVHVAGLTLDGAQAGDYQLTSPDASANITPAALTVTGIKAKDKVYDSKTTATLDTAGAVLTGVFAGDNVTLNAVGATGTFAGKDVGTGITVSVSGITTLGGAQAGNYTLSAPVTTANITPAAVTVTGLNADKAYDGTTAAVINASAALLNGVFAGDAVTVKATGATGTFAQKDVGSGIAVSVSGLALDGAQAGDYTLTPPTLTANITPAKLTVIGITASDKVYDSTTKATVDTTSAALTGVIAGDSLTLNAAGATGTFASKDAGSGVTVTVTGLTLSGAQANDYTFGQATTTANITPAALTVTGLTADKVYDGTTKATLNTSGAVLAGAYAGDVVSVDAAGATGTFASKNVGTGIAVTVSSLTLGGAQASDYKLTQSTLTGNITPADLTLTAVANSKAFDGTTSAAAIPTVSGLKGSDTVTGLSEGYNNPNAGTGKTLLVTGYTINDGNDGNNYNVSLVSNKSGVITTATTASHFAVSAPASTVAGRPFIITVTALDGSGATASGYSGTVHFTSSDPRANLPTDVTLTAGFGFFLTTLVTAGNQTINATDAAAPSMTGSSGTIAVTAAAATAFKFTSQPTAATTGTPFDVTVTALDRFGNPATGYNGLVHLASTDLQATLPADGKLTSGQGTFSVTLKTAGTQTLTAIDSVAVNPVITGTSSPITTRGLVVSSFTPTPTGFVVTFSKPFLPADLALYGIGAHFAPDVKLVGATNGPISGSLILDPSNMSLTFKATANTLDFLNDFSSVVLPDDTYTVTLASGSASRGFLDALGSGLDGNADAGHANFVTKFTSSYQANATPVLSIPDFARGPDGSHAINVPNDSRRGMPITLYNAAGVSDVTFTLSYNPALLSVAAVLGGAISDATDPDSTFSLVGTPTIIDATHATATFHFTASTPQSGLVVLGDVLASVPNSAAGSYKSKELLQLGNIAINGAAATGVVTANGVHINAYLGDVTGNGRIDALDVATASNVAQGKDTGFAAFRLVDPEILGDVALDYSVDAGAVSDIASFTVRLPVAVIPAIPTGLTITPSEADPTLSLGTPPSQPNGSPGDSFTVPVQLDQPHPEGSTGMIEAVLGLRYDPSVLSVTPADITLGSIPGLGTGWELTSAIDPAAGQVGIALYSTTAITQAQAGGLVYVTFHVLPGARGGTTAVQLVNSVAPNGQQFATQVDDAEGQLVLSPGLDRVLIPLSSNKDALAEGLAARDRVFAELGASSDSAGDLTRISARLSSRHRLPSVKTLPPL
jgi:hypothetical protein